MTDAVNVTVRTVSVCFMLTINLNYITYVIPINNYLRSFKRITFDIMCKQFLPPFISLLQSRGGQFFIEQLLALETLNLDALSTKDLSVVYVTAKYMKKETFWRL